MSWLNEDHVEALAELIINNDFKPTNDGQKELLRKFKKHLGLHVIVTYTHELNLHKYEIFT